MSVALRELDRALGRAERSIALLDRCRPLDAAVERARLLAALERGDPVEPRWVYRPAAGADRLRGALEQIAERVGDAGALGRLYAERALELASEAAIVEHLGTAELRQFAALRFPVDTGVDGVSAETLAREWASERGDDTGERIASDDERDPRSMISAMRAAVGERRLPFRVVLSAELACAAATGDDVIVVRSGMEHDDREVRRVVVHEVLGHALPRFRARKEVLGLFSVGTRQGPDDEEGRALLLERRHDCLGATRRAELGRRHLAALSVREGASWVETARLLVALGASARQAVEIASRTHRGGGLGREVVYLTALSRVERALTADPSLEAWMERGRVAVSAVAAMADLGTLPDVLPTKPVDRLSA